jgi:hypothetical protein
MALPVTFDSRSHSRGRGRSSWGCCSRGSVAEHGEKGEADGGALIKPVVRGAGEVHQVHLGLLLRTVSECSLGPLALSSSWV